jgi:putative transposase
MGIARPTFYDAPTQVAADTAVVEAKHAIKVEFEAQGRRRMQAGPGQHGWTLNRKRLKRPMRERLTPAAVRGRP